jgi:hypothetical protein
MAKQDSPEQDRLDKLCEALDRVVDEQGLKANGRVEVRRLRAGVSLTISTSVSVRITKLSAGSWGVCYATDDDTPAGWPSKGIEWDEAIHSFRGYVLLKLCPLLSDGVLRDVIELIK